MSELVLVERQSPLMIITINRPEARNAVNGPTSRALAEAFREFESDPELSVAILTGAGGNFCAGADLKAVASNDPDWMNPIHEEGDGPMGPSRMSLSKPVIAAVSGYCVAGGLELAAWCDMRVADETAVFGVFCRRFGVPLIDGGTVRLPRLIGMSHAMDMILTGRAVDAREAREMGLANRLVAQGQALQGAVDLARDLARFPQTCLRNDRFSALAQWGMSEEQAIAAEFRGGKATLNSGETLSGAGRFAGGEGKHGQFSRD
ncbi:MAG: crotonase/enoyl-CoA hydratase family protein [Oleiphilaceae bacterium]|nr:crotonase/enoyl-CoA hydratase family protein [Oleiphilaceae bacterium]